MARQVQSHLTSLVFISISSTISVSIPILPQAANGIHDNLSCHHDFHLEWDVRVVIPSSQKSWIGWCNVLNPEHP